MTATTIVRDIFSMLHDGTITGYAGDKRSLILQVDCLYLAERINPSFESLYVDLIGINKIELDAWTMPADLPNIIKTELSDIFKAELEIMSADIINEIIVINCLQLDPSHNYSGGNLSVSCNAIIVYDQDKNEISIEDLRDVYKKYWDSKK